MLNDFDSDEFDFETATHRGGKRPDPRRPQQRKQQAQAAVASLVKSADGSAVAASGFNPSFHGSRHERQWIVDALSGFYEDNHLTDVLRQVRGGKEANVYCCQAHLSSGVRLIAAKVYRPRMFRQLRNDAMYRQGRKVLDEEGKEVLDDGRLHAIVTGTRYGKELVHTSWLSHEFETLQMLYEAGALVPKPYARGSNAILMEYLGEVDQPAPLLNEVNLEPARARALFDELLHSVRLMLMNSRVHGDLSAYNVLYWDGQARIIDFPQAVDPHTNPHALPIFERDVLRLWQYFEPYGVDLDPQRLARDLWKQYMVPQLPAMDVPGLPTDESAG